MKKSLARPDMNLLITLQLLLQQQSVSKAAKILNVTPSTVSKSLNKLRDWFDDPLFIKTPTGLAPTPMVQSMEQELNDWLQMSSQILEKRSDVSMQGMQFNLMIESPLLSLVLEKVVPQIQSHFPDAKIRAGNWEYDSLDAIIRGEADIGFTSRESHPRSKESIDYLPYFVDFEVLFTDQPVVFLHKDHPALQNEWDLDAFLSYPHINLVWEKSETWALDEVLAEMGTKREVALNLSSFEQSLYMAAQPGHTMFATAPKYCQQYASKLHPELVCLPIPLEKQYMDKLTIPFTMLWHKRNSHNSKIRWLKESIKALYPDQ